MIATGLVALLLSTREHRQNMLQLRAEFGVRQRSVSGIVAAIVSVVGLLALAAVLVRV